METITEKEMYREELEDIKFLNKEELEESFNKEKLLPFTEKRAFRIGYMLLKLERIEEAVSFLDRVLGEELNKINVLYSLGYYEDPNGKCRTIYFPENHNEGTNNGDKGGCCSGICGCVGCAACVGYCVENPNDLNFEFCKKGSVWYSDKCIGTIESGCNSCC